jgi:hypothetical protein
MILAFKSVARACHGRVLNDFGHRVGGRVGPCEVICSRRYAAHHSEAAHAVNVDHVHAGKESPQIYPILAVGGKFQLEPSRLRKLQLRIGRTFPSNVTRHERSGLPADSGRVTNKLAGGSA